MSIEDNEKTMTSEEIAAAMEAELGSRQRPGIRWLKEISKEAAKTAPLH